jgi:Zn-dependent protease with chaperone function
MNVASSQSSPSSLVAGLARTPDVHIAGDSPNRSLPQLAKGQPLNIEAIRDPQEKYYLGIIYLFDGLLVLAAAYMAIEQTAVFAVFAMYAAMIAFGFWVSWKFTYWFVNGHGIEVTETQYPQVYRVVKEASDFLEIPIPQVIILQGEGLFELLVAKYFSRRGLLIITSNLMDEFSKRPSSREFMMFVGRQLGHIKAGHFRLWFVKETLGKFSLFFYFAWSRRCHFTADKIGLLVAGNIAAAERALYIISVGSGIAPSTSFDQIAEQRTRLFEHKWAWFVLGFSSYPYMIDRIVRLMRFADRIQSDVSMFGSERVGIIPIHHFPLRSIPILIIHGHDKLARLELENFMLSRLPNVVPRLMIQETMALMSMPEKFESVAADVVGAIAILTPDDIAVASVANPDDARLRARQNVVLEIGWVWAKLGRKRCLVLVRGELEIPSDILGVELFRFRESPQECSEILRAFITGLSGNDLPAT